MSIHALTHVKVHLAYVNNFYVPLLRTSDNHALPSPRKEHPTQPSRDSAKVLFDIGDRVYLL